MTLAPETAFPEPARVVRKVQRVVRDALAGKAGLLCVFAVLLAAGWAYHVDWPGVLASLSQGGSHYPVDPALLAQAEKLDLDYDAVAADPAAHAGKPVLWCLVKQMGMDRPVVNGNLSWIVNMQGGDIEAVATGRMGRCKDTLAVIQKSDRPGVHLAFAGHP